MSMTPTNHLSSSSESSSSEEDPKSSGSLNSYDQNVRVWNVTILFVPTALPRLAVAFAGSSLPPSQL